MMYRNLCLFLYRISIWMALAAFTTIARADDLSLPSIFSDHALLQAGKGIAIWGHAGAGAQVTVKFLDGNGASQGQFVATADAKGKWSGQLPAMKPGAAGQIEIDSDKGEKKIIQDVLVGEVWLASGQSNMSYNISGKIYPPVNADEAALTATNCQVAQKEAAAANPPIRIFEATGRGVPEPLDDVKGVWVLATADNVIDYSAVAWNFGVALQNALHEPIGLVISAVGGTPVETWMSMDTVKSTKAGQAILDRYNKAMLTYSREKEKANNAAWSAWRTANPTRELQDQNKQTRPPILFSPHAGGNPAMQYNALIHGLQPYTIKGVIWFQADGNQAHPYEYSELIQAMIKEWRAEWNDELPFYYVEMNNMRDKLQVNPVQSNDLSIIREQQEGALNLPKVGVVASIDLGTQNAHFPNKKPVGERLANLALKEVYNQPGLTLVNSPQYKNFQVEGNKVRVRFDYADGLRVRGGGDIKGFAVRGDKGDWVWANGSFDGTDILLWNDQVPSPTAVRYAWALFPLISIENKAGLPLRPFRTDKDSAK